MKRYALIFLVVGLTFGFNGKVNDDKAILKTISTCLKQDMRIEKLNLTQDATFISYCNTGYTSGFRNHVNLDSTCNLSIDVDFPNPQSIQENFDYDWRECDLVPDKEYWDKRTVPSKYKLQENPSEEDYLHIIKPVYIQCDRGQFAYIIVRKYEETAPEYHGFRTIGYTLKKEKKWEIVKKFGL